MQLIQKILTKNKYFYPLWLMILSLTFSPFFFTNRIINYDGKVFYNNYLEFSSLSKYLNGLMTFRTVDFQPVRDLSQFFDFYFFDLTGINISTFHNFIYLILICLIVEKIIQILVPDLELWRRRTIIFLFSLYPLWASIVGWGASQKHLLSALFILIATLETIRMEKANLKVVGKISGLYFLSVFSQPITLGWSVWFFLYLILTKKKEMLIKFSPILLITISCAWINYLYYEKSPTFAHFYLAKTNLGVEWGDRFLNLGHLVFQLFFPYSQSLTYQIDHWSCLAGLYLLLGLVILFVKYFLSLRNIIWFLFIFFPIGVVNNDPFTIYDSYLVLSFTGLTILLASHANAVIPNVFSGLILVGLLFSGKVFHEGLMWTSPETFYLNHEFARRPSCETAFLAGLSSYENFETEPTEVKKYFEDFECVASDKSPINSKLRILRYKNFITYYQPNLTLEQKFEYFSNNQLKLNLSLIMMADLQLQLGNTLKSDEILSFCLNRYGHKCFINSELIFRKNLKKYCEIKPHELCLKSFREYMDVKMRSYGVF